MAISVQLFAKCAMLCTVTGKDCDQPARGGERQKKSVGAGFQAIAIQFMPCLGQSYVTDMGKLRQQQASSFSSVLKGHADF